jgi:6-pyruvoyltetrahydropterin/6-carboxytetrahydropterin synthase
MFEVTVEETFAAGHFLPHGHNYKVLVTLQGRELDKAGLLMDFKDLKVAIKSVVERLDHQMINEIKPFDEVNPSAENLARYFYQETNAKLKSVTDGRVSVKMVTMFETDTTNATYYE